MRQFLKTTRLIFSSFFSRRVGSTTANFDYIDDLHPDRFRDGRQLPYLPKGMSELRAWHTMFTIAYFDGYGGGRR